jgi:pimeloyl-[acyl-carrier protein] synthase
VNVERLPSDPSQPECVSDPYQYYARLRAEDPVHRTPQGLWVLTRYDDVAGALRDPRFGREGFSALLETGGQESSVAELRASMLFQDPPRQSRLRALVGKAFTRQAVEDLRPHVQRVVDGLIDRAWGAGAMDLIADFAFPLPVSVITEMLGVPAADRDRFRQWSSDIARSLDAMSLRTSAENVERGNAAHLAIADYFRELIAERRRRPQADLVSALIAAEEAGDTLSDVELLTTCGLLFAAGHETTVNLVGNGMLALLRHPIELRTLRANPQLGPSAIEEFLRYDSPVQRAGRMTNTDVEIGGKVIGRGEIVSAVLGAANRDPARFPDADRLDLTRRDNRHLAFGSGVHFCLGAPLARMEGQIAIETLLRRLPHLALTGSEPRWRTSTEVRGLKVMPVTF